MKIVIVGLGTQGLKRLTIAYNTFLNIYIHKEYLIIFIRIKNI